MAKYSSKYVLFLPSNNIECIGPIKKGVLCWIYTSKI